MAACTPDISQEGPPPPEVVVLFDPGAVVPVVPSPNDLAIHPQKKKIVVPATEPHAAAQKEFNTDYLAGLDGFPFESTAEAMVSGNLRPDSVNANSVLVFDISNPAAPAPVPGLKPRFDPLRKTI